MLTVKSVDHHDVPIDEFNSNCQFLCLEEDVAVIFNCCVYSQRKFKGKKSYGVIVFFFFQITIISCDFNVFCLLVFQLTVISYL